MAIITLISDLGKEDHYLASVKGAIFTGAPDARVVDISHAIRPFDIYEASFVLKSCYSHFPEGTIHVVSVNDVLTESHDHVVLKYDGHYFIGADNGIFSILIEKREVEIFSLNVPSEFDFETFPLRSRFVTAACHLARGGTPEVIGKRVKELMGVELFKPLLEPNVIRGQVIYVDGYENVITNITEQTFRDVKKGRDFRINLVRSQEVIKKIVTSYADVAPGRALAIFGGANLLEIAISKGAPRMGGGAHSLLGLRINDTVRIEFE